MQIKSLIRQRIYDSEFEIYDPKGKLVSRDKFISDFEKIRNWLSLNLIEGNSLGSVGIKLPKDHRYLLTMFACMDAGVFYVPMNIKYPESRVAQIQEESGFKLLIDEDVYDSILAEERCEFFERDISSTDILYTICTSGSTGRPKAVVVQREAITHFWKWVDDKFHNVNSSDHTLQVTDFTFDISLIDVALFLHRGCKLYFSEFTGNVFTLAFEIERYGITTLNTVVNNVNMLLDDKVVGRADYSKLHTVMMGGARFSYGLYKRCMAHLSGVGVHNLYGVTEVPVYSHCKTLNKDSSDLYEFTVSVGQPLGACTGIVVKDGKKLGAGESGEILMGGGSLMKEYANNPEKTKEVFAYVDGEKYYRSGDIGFVNSSGDFFVTGRMDDTIKYRGYRINLLDIDSYILSLDYIQDCVTIAIEDEETQNKTVCFSITDKEISEKEMKKDLSNIVLEYQVPERIHFMKSFPVNSNGKVCKKTLKKDYIEGKRFYS